MPDRVDKWMYAGACSTVHWQQQPDGHVVEGDTPGQTGLLVLLLESPCVVLPSIRQNAPAARSSSADAMLSKPGVGSSRRVGSCVYRDCLLEPAATTKVLGVLLIVLLLHAAMPGASACTAAGGTLLATFSRVDGK
jgi:hypothetical protein